MATKHAFLASDSSLSDVEEFALMSSCDHFITANSSFSWWAAWLGQNPQKKPAAALFRSEFRCDSTPTDTTYVGGRICCDDGAVVFLNGKEVFRFNVPAGDVTHTTYATRAIGPKIDVERVWRPFRIPSDKLVQGVNVVAVSVHQVNSTSGDLAMGLELFTLSNPNEIASFEKELQSVPTEIAESSPVRIRAGSVNRLKFAND